MNEERIHVAVYTFREKYSNKNEETSGGFMEKVTANTGIFFSLCDHLLPTIEGFFAFSATKASLSLCLQGYKI